MPFSLFFFSPVLEHWGHKTGDNLCDVIDTTRFCSIFYLIFPCPLFSFVYYLVKIDWFISVALCTPGVYLLCKGHWEQSL